jgi:DNA-binding MarR family transcriptional regulator
VAEARFDDLIHAPHRLRICAMLSQADAIEFGEIQARTELSKSALSKHLSQLIDAGYVSEAQILRQGRSRLLLALTPAGRTAYAAHRSSLKLLLEEGD